VARILAGFWLGLVVASWLLASITFGTADALERDPGPELKEKLSSFAPADRKMVFRHMAAEINRTMFRRWLYVQFVLAIFLLAMNLRSGGVVLALAGLALGLLLVQLGLQGPMRELGQALDFVPRPLPPPMATRFGRLHGAYVLVDLVKMVALALLSWRMPS
jgi:hypothetical protein